MIQRVRSIFAHIVCKDPTVDITDPIKRLSDLFVEIICDGADFSIIGIFDNYVSRWFNRLCVLYDRFNDLNKEVYCY